MAGTTVMAPTEPRDKLATMAAEDGCPMSEVLVEVIEGARRRRTSDEADAARARLRVTLDR